MTLLQGRIGQTYYVKGISLKHDVEIRLQALGLTLGTKIIVLNNKRNGSVIFRVRGTRLAIGNEIAKAIAIGEEE